MCGRYTLTKTLEEIQKEFGLIDEGFEDLVFQPRYNIAPSQQSPVVLNEEGKMKIKMLRWGLIPFYAESEDKYLINARAESVGEKAAFKGLFKNQRCLVVADGFYEWGKADGHKEPYRITLKDERLFTFAGLWNIWDKGSEPVHSFTIITVDSNDLVGMIHNRMPLIIDRSNHHIWLDPDKNEKELKEIMVPSRSSDMDMYRVSRVVNNPENETPDCIKPMT